jgi:signal recognition particle subunit SRP54
MFSDLSEKLSLGLSNLRGRGKLSEQDISRFLNQTRESLLEADVVLSVVEDFLGQLGQQAREIAQSSSLNPAQDVLQATQTQLIKALGGDQRPMRKSKHPPSIVMLIGLQGSGKTTLAAKLAKHLLNQGHTPLLVAADLQRPNAVDQLVTVGAQAGVRVFAPEPGNGVGDPVAVARDGVTSAVKDQNDYVIVDTAGRLAVDEEMVAQAQAIKAAISPSETLFVVDSMTGQDAAKTGARFEETVGFDGVVLTKLDGDTRGGAALSLVGVCGKPILFASIGEKLDALEVFHPDRMASRILQLGDLATLSEQAGQVIDLEDAKAQAGKLASGAFTLQDFLEQLQSIKKMGSLSSLVGMLPGVSKAQLDTSSLDDGEIRRAEAIISSMTPAERAEPRLLDGARRARIAKGAGVSVAEINSLVKRFEQAKKMMTQAQGAGGVGAMGSMGSLGSMGVVGSMNRNPKGRSNKARPGSKGRSGNPAKRAQQERQRASQP